MIHANLVGMGKALKRLAADSGKPDDRAVKTVIALDVIRAALEPAHHEGLTLMVRDGELVVFETGEDHKPVGNIQYGGVGHVNDMKVVGGDGPLTFIVGMCILAKTCQVPLTELVEMLIAFAKAVFAGYHEAKGEGR